MKAFSLPQRFWAKVIKGRRNECWIWMGSRLPYGYGRIKWHGKMIPSHRLVMQSLGLSIAGCVVRHACDNPPCVNPAHLVIGTQLDNVRDMHAKGRAHKRGLQGEHHPQAKLTEKQIIDLRKKYASMPRFQSGLAIKGARRKIRNDFGISDAQLNRIVNRQRWRHI